MNLLRQYFLSYRLGGMQTALILAGLFASTGFAYGGDRGATVIGHHLRLEGTRLVGETRKIFEEIVRQCAASGITVASIPIGEKLSFMSMDTYFVPGAVTQYIGTKSYAVLLKPPCQLAPTKTENAVVDSPGGNCFVDIELRAASGNCRTPIAQLSQKRIRHSYLTRSTPTGEVRTIAGHKCKIYEGEVGGFLTRVCYASGDLFDGLAYGLQGAHGPKLSEELYLKTDLNTPVTTLSAVKVESNIPIPVSVLLPQLGDNFIIKGNR